MTVLDVTVTKAITRAKNVCPNCGRKMVRVNGTFDKFVCEIEANMYKAIPYGHGLYEHELIAKRIH
jgi:ribosomal protein S27AE